MKLKQTIDKINILRLRTAIYLLNLVIELQDLKISDMRQCMHVQNIMFGCKEVNRNMEELTTQDNNEFDFDDPLGFVLFDNSALEFNFNI